VEDAVEGFEDGNSGFDSGEGGWEDEIGWEGIGRQGEEDDDFTEEFPKWEQKRDKIKENWDILLRQMGLVRDAIAEIKAYPSSHRYLQEIPYASTANFLQCLN
jgi:hypothetical protein